MPFANIIMLIIIVLTLAVVVAVLWYGVKHDPHTSIRSPESSRAVQAAKKRAEAIQKKYEELTPPAEEK